jgi:hypothetical protein
MFVTKIAIFDIWCLSDNTVQFNLPTRITGKGYLHDDLTDVTNKSLVDSILPSLQRYLQRFMVVKRRVVFVFCGTPSNAEHCKILRGISTCRILNKVSCREKDTSSSCNNNEECH